MSIPVFDLVIIGSGPAGLATVARILEQHPAALYTDDERLHLHWLRKSQDGRSHLKTQWRGGQKVAVGEKTCSKGEKRPPLPPFRILVIDQIGSWMSSWNRLFAAYNIKHLRSPMFFHPAPADIDGLTAYAQRMQRTRVQYAAAAVGTIANPDLIEVPCVGNEVSKHRRKKNKQVSPALRFAAVNERERKDYFTPSLSLFNDFLRDDVINRYGLGNDDKEWLPIDGVLQDGDSRVSLAQGRVTNIDYTNVAGKAAFTITAQAAATAAEVSFSARAVVCAVGNANHPNIPLVLQRQPEVVATAWCHSLEMHKRGLPPPASTSTLVVIGGGLTSAQICHMAIEREGYAHVHLITRGHLKTKHFDVGLEWIGRYANLEKMCFWQQDDAEARFEAIKAARKGGSITPRYRKILRDLTEQGRLTIHECSQIDTASHANGIWTIGVINGDDAISSLQADFIIAATGASPAFNRLPFVKALVEKESVPEYGGLPFVDENLQYGSMPFFCTGAFSALQIGPAAFNLEGMRAAADRIAVRLQELLAGPNEREPLKDVSFTHFNFDTLASLQDVCDAVITR